MRWSEDQAKQYMAEYMVSKAPYSPPGSTTQEDKADEGTESKLSAKIIKWANEHAFPCQCFRQSKKARGFLVPGWPDCCLILPLGRTVFLELKSGKGRLSEDQKQMKIMFLHLGHEFYEINSYKKFIDIIGEY